MTLGAVSGGDSGANSSRYSLEDNIIESQDGGAMLTKWVTAIE